MGLRASICLQTDVARPGCGLAATEPLEEREVGGKVAGFRFSGPERRVKADPRHWGWNRCCPVARARPPFYRRELNGPESWEDLPRVTC